MIYLYLFFVVAFVASKHQAGAAIINYSFDIRPLLQTSLSPDCANNVFLNRPVLTVNGLVTGPTIEAEEGDIIVVNVTNYQQSESFAMHWHGIHNLGTPYSDGTSEITQCALGSLQSQVYRFLAYPPGTHFYHAHKSMIVADGASGMIIVTPNSSSTQEPTYDEERQVFLKDWWRATSDQQVVGLLSVPFVWVGSPDSILVNGKAIWFQCAQGGQYFNNSNYCMPSCTNASSSLETISVTAGKTYRLRIVNAGSLVIMNVAFEDHNLTVIEADGTMINPFVVDSLDLSPGQRYSVLLEANQDPAAYWMRVTVRSRNYPNVTGLAVLQYTGANSTVSTGFPGNVLWNDTGYGISQEGMMQTQDPSLYPEATALRVNTSSVRRFFLVTTQAKVFSTGALVWAVNNISSNAVTTLFEPLITMAYKAAKEGGWPVDIEGTVDLPEYPSTIFDYTKPLLEGPGQFVGSEAPLVLKLVKDEVVELVFQNTRALNNVSELHSWHSHGHSVWVVGTGIGIFDPVKDVQNFNLVNPLLRDKFDLFPFGWTAIRLVANNPGAWLFHEHVLPHVVMGLNFEIITQPNELGTPPTGATTCIENSLEESNASTDSATSITPIPSTPSASPPSATSSTSNLTSSVPPQGSHGFRPAMNVVLAVLVFSCTTVFDLFIN
mmetsp:Transcript_1951/g.2997  ORF Transcript_1951/g.2997 Transcript_1951/m.2997 type:complete len:663 (-) Transcript_1951:97-2085(-)